MPLREMWVTTERRHVTSGGQHATRLELFLAQERNKLSIFALQAFGGAASALESWIKRDDFIERV